MEYRNNANDKSLSKEKINLCALWHKRTGHVNNYTLEKMDSSDVLVVEYDVVYQDCVSCFKCKLSRTPFKDTGNRTNKIFGLVHMYICETLEIPSLGGAEYLLTFIEYFTRKVFIIFLNRKSEVVDKFVEFK